MIRHLAFPQKKLVFCHALKINIIINQTNLSPFGLWNGEAGLDPRFKGDLILPGVMLS